MPIEFIIIFIFLAVIALIGAACLILLLKGRKKGETGSIDDEMIDTVNKNIYDAKNELKNVIERESMALGAIVKTSAETMNSSAANNWANLQTAVKEQLKTSGENSEKRLGELIASEKESSDRLERRVGDFMNNVNRELKEMKENIEKSLQNVRSENERQLKEMRESNERKLNEMRETVDEKLTKTLNDRLDKSFSTVSERLEAVYKGLGEMKSLTDGVSNLNRMLINTKTRGNWGEVALGSLLDEILSREQYETQFRIDSKSEAVDFVIKMPGQRDGDRLYLPIDAKFPLEDYERLVECSDAGDKEGMDDAAKRLVSRIRQEARSISSKYISTPLTTNFAIMYLPIEGLFAEVVRRPGLTDELQRNYRIVICGPTTIAALLNSLQIGFKTLAVEKQSADVIKALMTFKKDFTKFTANIDTAKTRLESASKALDEASDRTGHIKKRLSKFESSMPDELIADTIGKESIEA